MRYVYDEEASNAWHMDVAHEEDDGPVSVERWQEACLRLNSITDPLARKILKLHERCATGEGECDADIDEPSWRMPGWQCATVALVADHFEVEYPAEDWTAQPVGEH